MMKRKEFMLGATFGLVLAAGATAGGVIDWPTANAGPVSGKSGRLTADAGTAGLFAPPQGAPLSFADIFQQVAPAVVQINVESRVTGPSTVRVPGLPFAIPVPEGEDDGEEGDGRTARGAGSGFFISPDGYIVTNNHVVADAVEITVVLADERELKAEVVGRDTATDLAVIKVDGSDFPFVTFEEQAQPRVGDWVIAVGNPFGLGGTATAGIVSGLGRQAGQFDPEDAGFVDFLQVDAAINRGNSGGPTFDIYGRVIGVNSAILSPSGVSAGIGFAIPAAIAKPVTDQLMRNGSVARGYVGLGLRTFSPEMWEAYGLPRTFDGAYVESVTEGGPAARGGVRVGDLLVAVNGDEVEDGTEAVRLVSAAKPGETVRLEVIRDGRRTILSIRAGTRPPEAELRAGADQGSGSVAPGQPPAAGGEVVEGLTVAPLSAVLRSRYNVPDDVTGLVITDVESGTPASRIGFEAGLVITQADRTKLRTVEDLRTTVETVKRSGRPGVLLFIRLPQGGTAPVVLSFDENAE